MQKDSLADLEESFVVTTKLSKQAIKNLDKWYSNQNIAVKCDIFHEQRNQYFKFSKQCENKNLVSVISFYLAIKHFYDHMTLHLNKNKSMNLESLGKYSNFSIKQFKKSKAKIKREKLITLWSVVVKLKNEDFSFREISNFLKSKHRFQVSHTYISQIWKELENEY